MSIASMILVMNGVREFEWDTPHRFMFKFLVSGWQNYFGKDWEVWPW